jgi:hypothetical protein
MFMFTQILQWAGLTALKIFGTAIPNIFRAGTFYQQGDFVFWDVHNAQNTIVIELNHEHSNRLIIEVADPTTAINLIKNAIYINRR